METKQIPLTLIDVEGFNYNKQDFSDVIYDPVEQIGKRQIASSGPRETVSDCSTTSGWPFSSHDDEERDVDD